ncbi:MAG: ABC transporter ATP-binding protein [Gemmatimonadaceae bacterium]|nr:ABC transporter ATP-binding protein [Acetobacteraceae bacterium]
MIEIENILVRFGGVTALDHVSARLAAGIVGLVGPNGAGKTTLLNVISGFLTPLSGVLALDSKRLDGLSSSARARLGLRRTFQQELVVETLSLEENIRAVSDHLGTGDRGGQIERALHLTGMRAYAKLPGYRLNLFQRRMTEIAKALVGDPKLILMDEPAAGLDEVDSAALRKVVAALPAETGAQVVIIDHDTQLISDLCAETMVLDFGKLLAFGPTRTVLDDPAVRQAYLGVGSA